MIDILIPTRGRIMRFVETMDSIVNTLSNQDSIRCHYYIDSNDYQTISSINENGWNVEHTNFLIGEENINLSQKWNQLYKLGSSEILFHGADDIIFETKDWDKIVTEHFKKYPESLLYGQDGHQNQNCPTHSFTSRSAADKIGYFVPPYFEADFNDVWLRDVYKKANRLFYNPDLVIRHNHVSVDSKFNDATYELAVERRKRAAIVWEEKKHLIDEDVKKLLA